MNDSKSTLRIPLLVDATSGVIGAVAAVLMSLALSVLPELDSAHAVRQFYNEWSGWLLLVLATLSAFFFGQLWSLGWLTGEMRRSDTEGPHSWIALAAELMFMTVFSVQVGVLATTHLIADRIKDESLYALHALGMVLAAPIAFSGAAYFAAIVVSQRRTGLLPTYLNFIAVLGVVGNISAIGGLFTLTGPWNAGNGALTVGLPFMVWFLWYAAIPGWYVRSKRKRQV